VTNVDANGNVSVSIGATSIQIPGVQITQTSPTTWTFVSPYPFQQTVNLFKASGFIKNWEDRFVFGIPGNLTSEMLCLFAPLMWTLMKPPGRMGNRPLGTHILTQ
jgi:hypothetical protein